MIVLGTVEWRGKYHTNGRRSTLELSFFSSNRYVPYFPTRVAIKNNLSSWS